MKTNKKRICLIAIVIIVFIITIVVVVNMYHQLNIKSHGTKSTISTDSVVKDNSTEFSVPSNTTNYFDDSIKLDDVKVDDKSLVQSLSLLSSEDPGNEVYYLKVQRALLDWKIPLTDNTISAMPKTLPKEFVSEDFISLTNDYKTYYLTYLQGGVLYCKTINN